MTVLSVSVLVLLAAVGLVLARRRGGEKDLVGTQLRAMSDRLPAAADLPADSPSAAGSRSPTGSLSAGGAAPAVGSVLDGLSPEQRGRVETLVAHNRRLQAINLVREATDCPLGEAKAAVDRLSAAPRTSVPPGPHPPGPHPPGPHPPGPHPPGAPAPAAPDLPGTGSRPPARRGQFPPGFDIDPRHYRRPTPK